MTDHGLTPMELRLTRALLKLERAMEGRFEPPTRAEALAHFRAGGSFLVTNTWFMTALGMRESFGSPDPTYAEIMRALDALTRSGEGAPHRWVAVDASGQVCPEWPVATLVVP